MVSRCYRGKKRCFEFTRYSMVVKMLKQQLSAPRSFLSSDVGMYIPSGVRVCVCVYVCVRDLDYTKLRLPLWRLHKNMGRTFRTTIRDCEKWRATLQLPFFREIENHSRFDASGTIFTVSLEMIRVEISRNVESEIKYRYTSVSSVFCCVYNKCMICVR